MSTGDVVFGNPASVNEKVLVENLVGYIQRMKHMRLHGVKCLFGLGNARVSYMRMHL